MPPVVPLTDGLVNVSFSLPAALVLKPSGSENRNVYLDNVYPKLTDIVFAFFYFLFSEYPYDGGSKSNVL